MDTPFTKAAKRGEVFFEEPIMVAFPPETPRCTTYSLQIGPVCARDPASARPKPSRMDFLPSSMTSPGISSYFVEATNLLTYSVKPRALGKSLPDARPALSTEPARKVDPSTPREVLPKSRLNKVHPLFQTVELLPSSSSFLSSCRGYWSCLQKRREPCADHSNRAKISKA